MAAILTPHFHPVCGAEDDPHRPCERYPPEVCWRKEIETRMDGATMAASTRRQTDESRSFGFHSVTSCLVNTPLVHQSLIRSDYISLLRAGVNQFV